MQTKNTFDRSFGALSRVKVHRFNTRNADAADHNDYLMHFGITGMKWGIRRFQNEDRTLTEEGKERYRKTPESKTWKKKDVEELSDEELRRRNNRLNAERQYKDLMTKSSERERAQFRQEFKKSVLKAALITSVTAAVGILAKKHINADAVSRLFSKFAGRKIASLKAAGMIKNVLKKQNIPDATINASREILGKHVFRV